MAQEEKMLFHLLESTASSFMLFLDLKNYILVLVLSTAPQTSWSSIKNTSGKLFFFYPVSQITVDPSPCQTLLRQIHILNSCWQVQVHFFSSSTFLTFSCCWFPCLSSGGKTCNSWMLILPVPFFLFLFFQRNFRLVSESRASVQTRLFKHLYKPLEYPGTWKQRLYIVTQNLLQLYSYI